MNKEAIKAALHLVHESERSSSNPNGMKRAAAVEHVLRTGPKLTHAEVDVLLSALHVKRTEITVQWTGV